jgi:hypothetical protein
MKNITAENAKDMTDEQIVQAQESLDEEREKIRERGRVLKAEVTRRRTEETVLAKLRNNISMTQGQSDYYNNLPKEEARKLAVKASHEAAERAKQLAERLGVAEPAKKKGK